MKPPKQLDNPVYRPKCGHWDYNHSKQVGLKDAEMNSMKRFKQLFCRVCHRYIFEPLWVDKANACEHKLTRKTPDSVPGCVECSRLDEDRQ